MRMRKISITPNVQMFHEECQYRRHLSSIGEEKTFDFFGQPVTDFEIEICPDYLLSSQIQVRLGWKIN